MPFQKASPADAESVLPDEAGHMWFLKDALGTEHVAFTVLELEPNVDGKRHDHRDQEEVYYVEDGAVDVDFGDRTVTLEEGEALRVDPEEERQLRNRDAYSRLVLVGAPRDAE
ncbi:MAG: cupin domain-containing protein [Halobacteriaceae archaeon]